jgi:TonB-dependent starch-binding outer membrane protein SusC
MTRRIALVPSKHASRSSATVDRLSLACLFVVALVSSAARAQSTDRSGRRIFGTIVDIDTSPVANATVTVAPWGPTATTDAGGHFRLTRVATTHVVVKVVADGFLAKQISVLADAAEQELLVTVVRPQPVVIVGQEPVMIVRPPPVRPRPAMTRRGDRAVSDPSRTSNAVAAVDIEHASIPKSPRFSSIHGSLLHGDSAIPGAAWPGRGISSLSGDSTPVYVIDGVIVSHTPETSGINALLLDPLRRIPGLDPDDIETLQVLKSASAAAMYGSRTAEGVVVITTKRGHSGQHRAMVTQRFGFARPSNKLGSHTFATADEVCQAFCNTNPALIPAYLESDGKTYDHEAEFLRTAFAMETVGAVTGGSDNTSYRGSVLYRDHPGVVAGTHFRTQSGRFAIDRNLGTGVRVGITANLIHSLSDRGITGSDNLRISLDGDTPYRSLYSALAAIPSFVNLQPTNGIYPVNPASPDNVNPLQSVRLLQNREDVWRRIVGSTLSIDAYQSADGTSAVKLRGNLGVDSVTQKNRLVTPDALLFESGDSLSSTVMDESTTNLHWHAGGGALWRLYPQSRTFRSALSAGITYEVGDLESALFVSQGLAAGLPGGDAAKVVASTGTRLRTKDVGVYAQEELAVLDDRLLLIAGLIAERSSRNGSVTKYHLFPKLVAAYSLVTTGSSEPDAFDMLGMLRVAYGEAGKAPAPELKFVSLSPSLGIVGIPGGSVNVALEPERAREVEAGLDLATRNQRIVVQLTGYQRKISNLILQRSAPSSTGFTTTFENSGGFRHRGLEVAIQLRPIATRHVEWTSHGMLTLDRSVITDVPNEPFQTSGTFGYGLGAHWIEPGRSPTEIVTTIGSSGERVAIGNTAPDLRVGWSNVVSFGDVTFTAHLAWQHGSNIVNMTRLQYDFAGNSPDVEAANQRLGTFMRGDVRPYVEDASFVKLREVTVSYTLPRRLAAQLGPLKRLELSMTGRNLTTFTRYSGLDPELSNASGRPLGRLYDLAPYPPSRSYWLSVTAGI